VLRLRALRSSNDFDAYWKFHEQQEYERNHASHYADHLSFLANDFQGAATAGLG
jgi:hypothetical protein